MKPDAHLAKISKARVVKQRSDAAFRAAIIEARADGLPLRAIADVAGMSHESVRAIVGATVDDDV